MENQVWENEFGRFANSGQCSVRNCDKIIIKSNHCNGDSNHNGSGVWEIDHEHPSSKGGSDRLSNKRSVCCDCNRKKADSTSSKWR